MLKNVVLTGICLHKTDFVTATFVLSKIDNNHVRTDVLYYWGRYNSMATSLTIEIGSGNFGAVGIRLRGAQGSGIEDVTILAGDGLAGVVGGCGSGGAHHGLRVVGGRYGLDLRQSQPTGTVSGSTLEGQRCAGLIYGGFESLSAVGMNITGQRGCFAAVSTAETGASCDPETPNLCTYYLPGAPREECSLPLMPAGPGFPSDYQKSNPGIAAKSVPPVIAWHVACDSVCLHTTAISNHY